MYDVPPSTTFLLIGLAAEVRIGLAAVPQHAPKAERAVVDLVPLVLAHGDWFFAIVHATTKSGRDLAFASAFQSSPMKSISSTFLPAQLPSRL